MNPPRAGRAPEAERRAHWDRIHRKKDPTAVSWYEARPVASLRLVEAAGFPAGASVLDVGGGTSTLVDHLLAWGYRVGVLDISREALVRSRERLGPRASEVEWFRTDVTRFRSPHPWDLWHDRAVLHFLTGEADRRAYRRALLDALAPGGQAVIATFGPEGPTRCSGLDVRRHGAPELEEFLGPELVLVESATEAHRTPAGGVQQFLYCRFRGRSAPAP